MMDERFDEFDASDSLKNPAPQICAQNTSPLNALISPEKLNGRKSNAHVCFPPNYSGLLIIMMASSNSEDNFSPSFS